jgi:Rrf2 family iron-sulfur cluster assembly transcriptional regulator
MKLSTKARYAVMAMTDLVTQASEHGACSLSFISERQGLPLAYLEQIFLKLRKQGLVTSVRGASGGYVLARPANDVRIYDIISAVDLPLKATRCGTNSPVGCQPHGARCLTHDLWEGLGTVVEQYLKGVTLSDVCNKKANLFAKRLQIC